MTDSAIFFGICGHDGGNRGHDPWNLSNPLGILSLIRTTVAFCSRETGNADSEDSNEEIIEVLRLKHEAKSQPREDRPGLPAVQGRGQQVPQPGQAKGLGWPLPEWAYRYSRFCGRYREWRARQKRSLRQQHRAGEKAFIDYC